MRSADIKPLVFYRAEVEYRTFKKVRAVETGVTYDPGYGRNRRRRDGVRCTLEEEIRPQFGRTPPAVGDLLVLPSRLIQHEWSDDDEADRIAGEVEETRKLDIERRLGEAGYAEASYNRETGEDEGDFSWHGDLLQLTPKLTEELLNQADL